MTSKFQPSSVRQKVVKAIIFNTCPFLSIHWRTRARKKTLLSCELLDGLTRVRACLAPSSVCDTANITAAQVAYNLSNRPYFIGTMFYCGEILITASNLKRRTHFFKAFLILGLPFDLICFLRAAVSCSKRSFGISLSERTMKESHWEH